MKALSPNRWFFALCIWFVTLVVLWPHAVAAQAQDARGSLASDIRGFDLESLLWAVIMSLMGGGLRTIFTMATDDEVVLSFGREMLKDSIVAMIAGALAYIVIEAVRAFGALPIPSEVRFAVIVFAGWSRLSFFGWLNKLGTRVTDAVEAKIAHAIANRALTAGTAGRFDTPADATEPDPTAPAPTPAPSKPKPFQEKP